LAKVRGYQGVLVDAHRKIRVKLIKKIYFLHSVNPPKCFLNMMMQACVLTNIGN